MSDKALRDRIEELEEEVRQLRAELLSYDGELPFSGIHLTRTEDAFIRAMLRRQLVKKSTLRLLISEDAEDADANIYVHVSSLRRKLAGRYSITSMNNVGYRLVPVDAPSEPV